MSIHRFIMAIVWMDLLFSAVKIYGQDEDSLKVKKLEVRGYVKDLQSLTFNRNFDSLVTGNLIHNRINVRWNPSDKFTAGAEFRNRLFWGEEVRLTPDFSSGIRYGNEAADLTILWFETESMLLQTEVDRLWMEYHNQKWNVRLGRQRINWGISTLWNPNDIFNTYNFLDFDYEERPGRDAVKITHHLTEMSNLEFAFAATDESDKSVGAIKYFVNRWSYDFQFSAGVYNRIFTMGTGWSGSIGEAGFKGELQYFAPHRDTTAQVNLTMETDYVFENGWYTDIGLLFNSAGINQPVENWSLVSFQLSPQSLMPTKWNGLLMIAKEFTPLLSANMTMIYSPGTNLLIFFPSLKYNLANNLDFDLIWQSFFAEQYDEFGGVVHRGYLRVKWSF